MTTSTTQVVSSINSIVLGSGGDQPESYARVLYETTADNAIGWRSGSKKIVVAWLDDSPHDCGLGTGVDPGRDGIAGNTDDLAMNNVLAEMATNNITLIVLNSNNWVNDNEHIGDLIINLKTLWEGYAQSTGGEAFKINSNGTIPDNIDIAQYITEKIQNQTGTIDELTLKVCTPGFESWLSNVSPASYTDLDLTTPFTNNFEATFTVPGGTADGVYNFDVCLIGDGAEYGRQHVTITVVNTVPVPLDIKPGACPNPINRGAKGFLPVAIQGFEGVDVAYIDPATIRLEGIAPVKWAVEDVATPYYPFIDKVLNNMSCNTAGPDGFVDLTLKFDNLSISALLAGHLKGDIVKLHITGVLMNGTQIAGEDIVVIVK